MEGILTLSLYDFLFHNQDKIHAFLQKCQSSTPQKTLLVDEAQISPDKLQKAERLRERHYNAKQGEKNGATVSQQQNRTSNQSTAGLPHHSSSTVSSTTTVSKFNANSFSSSIVDSTAQLIKSPTSSPKNASPKLSSPPATTPSGAPIIPPFFISKKATSTLSPAQEFSKLERVFQRYGEVAYANVDAFLDALEIGKYMKHTFWNGLVALHSDDSSEKTPATPRNHAAPSAPESIAKSTRRKFNLKHLQQYFDHKLSGKDRHERYFHIFKQDNNRRHLVPSDFKYLVRDLIDMHPGLAFLNEHDSYKHFHAFYSECVIVRIFFNVAQRGADLIALPEFKRSNFVQQLEYLNDTDNINTELSYFSYEHFYVLFCKLWELDTEHTYMLTRDKLLQYSDYALTEKIINRVFDGHGRKVKCPVKDRFGYEDFIWFVLCEEDKTTSQSLEYWFRCVDIDADGIITTFEMEYFFKEQLERMALVQQEIVSFDDVYSQIIDMIKPKNPEFITLSDIKRSKMGHLFFNILFNLNKFLIFEQKATSMKWNDWASAQYELMMAEEGG